MAEPAETANLADAFWAVARRLRGISRDTLRPWDLAPSQARALRVLGRHGRMRPGELAAELRIAPRSSTDVLDALQGRGLVARHPDQVDRRATVVALTEAGTRTVAAIEAAQSAEVRAHFGSLSRGDQAELGRILRLLAEASAAGEQGAGEQGAGEQGAGEQGAGG